MRPEAPSHLQQSRGQAACQHARARVMVAQAGLSSAVSLLPVRTLSAAHGTVVCAVGGPEQEASQPAAAH